MKVAFLTAGGIAPCLTASIGSLIKEYTKVNNAFEFIGYLNGYKGLLKGYSVKLDDFSNIDNLNPFIRTVNPVFLVLRSRVSWMNKIPQKNRTNSRGISYLAQQSHRIIPFSIGMTAFE